MENIQIKCLPTFLYLFAGAGHVCNMKWQDDKMMKWHYKLESVWDTGICKGQPLLLLKANNCRANDIEAKLT